MPSPLFSYMLPLVVASGLLIAIGNLMGGEVVTDLSKMTIPSALTSLGGGEWGFFHHLSQVIFLTHSRSSGYRSRLPDGGRLLPSWGAGFPGGRVGGYIVGYIALFIRESEGSTLGRSTDADDDYTDIIFYRCRITDTLSSVHQSYG